MAPISFRLVLALLFLPPAVSAIATPVHPDDPTAVLLDSVEVITTISIDLQQASAAVITGRWPSSDTAGASAVPDAGGTPQTYLARHLIYVWRGTLGRIDVVLDPASVRVIGSQGAVDVQSSAELFGELARDGVRRTVMLGYATCPSEWSDTAAVSRVYCSPCVARSGAGDSTLFFPCDSSPAAVRDFAYACPDGGGEPQLVLRFQSCTSCAAVAFCEPTCADANGDDVRDVSIQ